jgi:hypothetical protein
MIFKTDIPDYGKIGWHVTDDIDARFLFCLWLSTTYFPHLVSVSSFTLTISLIVPYRASSISCTYGSILHSKPWFDISSSVISASTSGSRWCHSCTRLHGARRFLHTPKSFYRKSSCWKRFGSFIIEQATSKHTLFHFLPSFLLHVKKFLVVCCSKLGSRKWVYSAVVSPLVRELPTRIQFLMAAPILPGVSLVLIYEFIFSKFPSYCA